MSSAKVIDFPALAERLLAESLTLLQQWFPAGKIKGREFSIGNIKGDSGDSLSINIDNGKWHDFSTGDKGGDLISLYAAIHGIKQGDAAKQLGGSKEPDDEYIIAHQCHPIPRHKHGRPSNVFEYRNLEGQIIGYICRFDPLNEKKQFAPLTCWKKADATLVWKWKKWPIASPIYHADKIAAQPAAKILIVEGEKKADLAQRLLPPDWLVVGWCGGAEAVKRTDWSALLTRYCWIWPDNDDPGKKAAAALKKILPDLHIVAIPDDLPQGWDLGDALDGFDILKHCSASVPVKQLTMQEVEVAGRTKEQQRALMFTHIVKDKPLATLENLRDLFNSRNIRCRYNVISKRVMFDIPNESFSVENGDEVALALIYSYIKQEEMPVDGYKAYTLRIADENQYNPVLAMIEEKPWDRIDRLQSLYDTIESSEPEAKELLIRRWLITCVCMALGEGVDSAGCIVLQGPQDIGKTWWVRKLIPEKWRKELIRTDATVDPKDKDSVSQIISYWIVELGEIGATFRKADIDALKAFITRDHDTMRRPYGEGDKRYPRRTALIASVDQSIYLHDTAGNRRFWTIPCTSINSRHEINMQQVWAQVLTLVKEGETWQLEPDEKEHIRRINETHMQIEPIIEMIIDKYDGTLKTWKTASQVASEIGLKNITQRETRIIASYLRKMKYENRDSRGNNQFLI